MFQVELSNADMNALFVALSRASCALEPSLPRGRDFGTFDEWQAARERSPEYQEYRQTNDLCSRLKDVCIEQADPYDVGRLEGYALASLDALLHKEAV